LVSLNGIKKASSNPKYFDIYEIQLIPQGEILSVNSKYLVLVKIFIENVFKGPTKHNISKIHPQIITLPGYLMITCFSNIKQMNITQFFHKNPLE
jgi:hypothetical protein